MQMAIRAHIYYLSADWGTWDFGDGESLKTVVEQADRRYAEAEHVEAVDIDWAKVAIQNAAGTDFGQETKLKDFNFADSDKILVVSSAPGGGGNG